MVQCPSCSTLSPLGTKYCAECGTDIRSRTVRCAKCFRKNSLGAEFCAHCGCNLAIEEVLAPERRKQVALQAVRTTADVGSRTAGALAPLAGCIAVPVFIILVVIGGASMVHDVAGDLGVTSFAIAGILGLVALLGWLQWQTGATSDGPTPATPDSSIPRTCIRCGEELDPEDVQCPSCAMDDALKAKEHRSRAI